MTKIKKIIPFIFFMFLFSGVKAQNEKGLKVLKTFHIASAGGWDYIQISPVTNWLYVSHSSQVNILDKSTGDSVGVIQNTNGVHGIAFDPIHKLGFTSNGRSNTVTVFDAGTNAVLREIAVGKNPDAIAYEPFSKTIITCNSRSNDLSVIDPVTFEVIHTITLDGRPETAVSDDAGHFYINLEDKSAISILDTRSFKITNTWSLAPGEGPAGLAMDKKTHRLFAGCDKLLVIMNAETGKITDTKVIGEGCDGVAFDDGLKTIYTSNGEGNISVIKEKSKDQFSAEGNVETKRGARTIVCDENTHLLYLPFSDYETQAPGEKGRPKMKPGTFGVIVAGR